MKFLRFILLIWFSLIFTILPAEGSDLFPQEISDSAFMRYKTLLLTDPQSKKAPEAQYQIGLYFYYRKNYDAAIQEFQRLLKNYPHSDFGDKARFLIGESYRLLEREGEAISNFLTLINLYPSSPLGGEASYRIAEYHYTKREYLSALRNYRRILELYPKSRSAPKAKAKVKEIIKEKLSLKELEELLVESYPGSAIAGYALLRRAKLQIKAKSYAEAENTIERFLERNLPLEERREAEGLLREVRPKVSVNRNLVGCLGPFSGRYREYGLKVRQGIELAWEEISLNYREGPTLIFEDTEGDPAKAERAALKLINEDKVIALIGPVLSSTTKRAAIVANNLRVPLITPSASAAEIATIGPYIFRNCLTNTLQGRAIADYALKQKGFKRLAILYPDDPYGKELADIFTARVIELGGKVVASEKYQLGETDFKEQILRMGGIDPKVPQEGRVVIKNEKGIEAIYLPGYLDEIVLIAPQLFFYDLGLPLLGSNGWNRKGLVELGKRYVEGAVFTAGFFLQNKAPHVQAFVDSFKRKFETEPEMLSAQAYDAAKMVLQLISSGIATREELRNTLAQLRDFPGVSGRISFSGSGDAEKGIYILKVEKGEIVKLD